MFYDPGWYAVVIAAAALAYTIYDRRGARHEAKFRHFEAALVMKASALEVTHLTECVDKLEERATKVEAHMEHLPSKDTSHRLEIALSKMEGEMSTLAERIKPIAAMSARLQEKLIEGIGGA
jgi:hypothetical protein